MGELLETYEIQTLETKRDRTEKFRVTSECNSNNYNFSRICSEKSLYCFDTSQDHICKIDYFRISCLPHLSSQKSLFIL